MNESVLNALYYIRDRLREPSTYPALILVATGITHWSVADAATKQQIFLDIGMMVAGLIGAALPDRMGKNTRSSDAPPAPAATTTPPSPQEKKP